MRSSLRYPTLVALTALCLTANLLSITGCSSRHQQSVSPALPLVAPPHTCLQNPDLENLESTTTLPIKKLGLAVPLQKPYYSINNTVQNDGLINHYQIDSAFGEFAANGDDRLAVVISEIEALQTLEEISNAQIVVDSVSKEAVNLVFAPARAVVKAGKVIFKPAELFDTLMGAPRGVINFFGTVFDKLSGGSETISEAVKEAEEEVGGDTLLETSGRVVKRAGKRLLGFQPRYKKWLKKLNVDPYSTNTQLLEKIEAVAWLETSINFSFNFVPGVAGVVVVDRFNRYHKRIRQIADYDDPGVLRSELWVALTDLGVDQATKQKFFKHKAYTNTTRFRIVESLKELKHLKNPGKFIELANRSKTEDHTFFYATIAEQLTELERSGILIQAVREDLQIPTFESESTTILILPADYMLWTKENALIFSDLRSRVPPTEEVHLWSSAALSPTSQRRLKELNIKVSPLLILDETQPKASEDEEEAEDSLLPPEITDLFSSDSQE